MCDTPLVNLILMDQQVLEKLLPIESLQHQSYIMGVQSIGIQL